MTIISFKHKFIFMSNPRCGSTSIREFFEKNKLCDISVINEAESLLFYGVIIEPHINASNLSKFIKSIGYNINDFKIFTTVRNPYDLHVSLYNYSKCDSSGRPFWLSSYSGYDPTFNINEFIKLNSLWPYRLFTYVDNKCIVNNVYKIEEFTEEIICNILQSIDPSIEYNNLPYRYKKSNESYGNTNHRELFNNETYALLNKIYSNDFEQFGYTMIHNDQITST